MFNVTAYREATRDLSDARAAQIDSVQATFKEASLPVQLIETDDRAKVAIVFERVNRLGVELDTLQLLSAWTWSEEFDLQERFRDLSDELKPFGFAGVGEDTNLLLRVCAAVVAGDVSAPTLLGLNGTEVRNGSTRSSTACAGRSTISARTSRPSAWRTCLTPRCSCRWRSSSPHVTAWASP